MRIQKFSYKKVISTNNTAINIIKRLNLRHGMIVSEEQAKGRGQYGRKWLSLKGNLFVSFFYDLDNINLSLQQLTKINCLFVKKIISKFCKEKIVFKEPNDLMINNKKVCGILQETIFKKDKKYLIVGIGINIIKSPNLSKYKTTNLFEITGKKINNKLLAKLLKLIFEKKLSKFYK